MNVLKCFVFFILLYIQTNLIAVENVIFVNTKRKLYGVLSNFVWDFFVSARKHGILFFSVIIIIIIIILTQTYILENRLTCCFIESAKTTGPLAHYKFETTLSK